MRLMCQPRPGMYFTSSFPLPSFASSHRHASASVANVRTTMPRAGAHTRASIRQSRRLYILSCLTPLRWRFITPFRHQLSRPRFERTASLSPSGTKQAFDFVTNFQSLCITARRPAQLRGSGSYFCGRRVAARLRRRIVVRRAIFARQPSY